MYLLLGGSGHIGQAFQRRLTRLGRSFQVIARHDTNYANRDSLIGLIRETNASFLINAAGFTGKPNVDACEIFKADCLMGNAVLPGTIREACEETGLPWGHVSSGCIFTGRRSDGGGFQETDDPNFCFRTNNCSFYSGCKAIGEETLMGAENVFQWRLRIPFSDVDGPRNYLSKLIRYDRLLEAENSISQLDDFARCAVETWERRVPFGTYNITNTGAVTTRRVVKLIQQELKLDKQFRFFLDESEFMRKAVSTPRSNCVLDNSKLTSTGIEIDHVDDAILKALRQFKFETSKS